MTDITRLRELARSGVLTVSEIDEVTTGLPALLDELEAARKVVEAARKERAAWTAHAEHIPLATKFPPAAVLGLAEAMNATDAALSAHAAAGKGGA